MSKGDVVVAITKLNAVGGIGLIRTDYLAPNHPDNPNVAGLNYKHYRRVDWLTTEGRSLDFRFGRQAVTPVNEEQWKKILTAYTVTGNDDFQDSPPPDIESDSPLVAQLMGITEHT